VEYRHRGIEFLLALVADPRIPPRLFERLDQEAAGGSQLLERRGRARQALPEQTVVFEDLVCDRCGPHENTVLGGDRERQ